MAFVLPSKSQVGVVMNPELAAEWGGENKVVLGDGTEISYTPAPPKPVMPDWTGIKAIRHYFNRSYKNNFWPAWIYNHENGEERIVRSADEAAQLGICYRPTTQEEGARFGVTHVWDWKDDCPWRPTPMAKPRHYDPRRPEQGKEFIATPTPQATANRELLNTVLPEVTAAVVAALKQGGNVNPANVDPKQWDEFLAFQAWKKTQEAMDAVSADADQQESALSQGDERDAWVRLAEEKGIRVDNRWSLDTLKERVQRAA